MPRKKILHKICRVEGICEEDIGKFVRVVFDDIGAADGIIIDVRKDDHVDEIQFFDLSTHAINWLEFPRVIEMGKYMTVCDSGLTGT